MSIRQPQIGVRVEPQFRAELKEVADRYFGGNESLLFREAVKKYIRMRRKLGAQFEPFLATIIGEDDDQEAA